MKPTPVKPVRLVDASDIGHIAKVSKKSKKAKTSDTQYKNIPPAGAYRERKAWANLDAALRRITDWYEWLSVLYDWMLMPKRAQVKYTLYSQTNGKPIKFSWVPDKNSASRQFTYHNSCITKFTAEITAELDSLMKQAEKTKLPVLYSTPYKDSVDTAVVRRIVIYRDYIQTGGSHNEPATYAHALVFAPICAEYEVLSGD